MFFKALIQKSDYLFGVIGWQQMIPRKQSGIELRSIGVKTVTASNAKVEEIAGNQFRENGIAKLIEPKSKKRKLNNNIKTTYVNQQFDLKRWLAHLSAYEK